MKMFAAAAVLSAALIASCSSAPKKPAEITSVRDLASTNLTLAARACDRGDYAGALDLLGEARRAAVSTDDIALRVRTALLKGNILLYQGKTDEAAASWNDALADAESSDDPGLGGGSRVYIAFGQLWQAIQAGQGASKAQAALDTVNADSGALRKLPDEAAFAQTTAALAWRELGRYKDAEAAAQKAFAYHNKNNFLEKAAYDSFLIASIRSVGGDYDGALKSLDQAIDLDRRAENSTGLAADWNARAEVCAKKGDTAAADAARKRAEEIRAAL